MKLNAAALMQPLSLAGCQNMHPFAPADQAEGYMQWITELENDLATILTDAIESKEEIDLRRAEEAKQRAEARLDDPNMDMRRAEVALKKEINRISVKNDLK